MKVIDGKGLVLGRLASYAAKEALKGEEVVVLNSEQVMITGNHKDIKNRFHERRTKIGSGQKGPKVSRLSHLIVKRAIRGMLPDHRSGRGKECLKRIKCFNGIPREFQESTIMELKKEEKIKFSKVGEFTKRA